MTWSLAPANTPRFLLPDNELLVEGARINRQRNAGALGALPGTPGTPPQNWNISGTGLTRQIIGYVVEDNIQCVDMRLFGTSGAGHYTFAGESGTTHFSAQVGEIWTYSIYARLIAGTPRTTRGHLRQLNSSGGILGDIVTTVAVPTSGPLATNRLVATAALNQAATARLQAFIQVNFPIGTVIDDTWRLGAPQLELGAFASSPMLPAPGTIAASSRGDEGLSVLLADVLVPASGACTLLLAGRLGQAAPAGVTQMVAQIDDGTDDNRVLVYCAPGTASIRMRAVLAGVAGPEVTLGTVVPGQIWRLIASLDGAGRLAASLDGAAALAVTGGPTVGLVAALFGTSRAGEALFGTLRHTQVIPAPTQDAALPALAALMP